MKPLYFLAAPALFLLGCGPKTPDNTAKDTLKSVKKEAKAERDAFSGIKSGTLQGGELSGGDAQGRPLWKVSAKTIRMSGGALGNDSAAPKNATLSDARATLYRDGKPESSLQAPQITLFYLKNGVRLQFAQGMKGTTEGNWIGKRGKVSISAPRADVDVAKRVLSASGGVQMTQGELVISAQTLRSQTSLEKVEVAGKVRAQTKENGRIDAKSAIYNWKTNQVVAQNVSAERDGTRLSGDSLSADTLAASGVLTGSVRAQSSQSQASAPRLDFDWKRDQIRATNVVFAADGATLRASDVVTDSKLRLASAQSVVAEQDGAVLRAASATGFDGLNRFNAREVDFRRGDLQFSAPRANAQKHEKKWVLVAEGGARAQNSAGKVSAPNVTWDENRDSIAASGGVSLQKDGATLRGQSLQSDSKFQNAILQGEVRAQMPDGAIFTAQTLEKRGVKLWARTGATARFPARKVGVRDSIGVLTLRAALIEANADGSSARASGGVSLLTSTGATARAPRATYNRAKSEVIASGGVDFFDPARGLRTRGDTLVYNLKTNRAALSNTRGQGNLNLFEGKKLF